MLISFDIALYCMRYPGINYEPELLNSRAYDPIIILMLSPWVSQTCTFLSLNLQIQNQGSYR